MPPKGTVLPLHHRAVYHINNKALTRKRDKGGTNPRGVIADSHRQDAERLGGGQEISGDSVLIQCDDVRGGRDFG